MIWEFKKSIIKFVLTPLFTKFHVLLSLPASCAKIPGFPLHLDKPQLIFMDLLETLSQVKINPVLVLGLTLCHEMKPSVYRSRRVLDLHLHFCLIIWSLSVAQQSLRWPENDSHLLSFNLLPLWRSRMWMWLPGCPGCPNPSFPSLPCARSLQLDGTG